jgi:hypothetical protein
MDESRRAWLAVTAVMSVIMLCWAAVILMNVL